MDDKEFYLDAMKGIVPEQKEVQLQNVFYSFLEIEHLYDSAINVVKTQLNILNNEFNMRFQRNPIHSIESRIKTPQSIIGETAKKRLCSFSRICTGTFAGYCRRACHLLLY